MKIIIHCSNKHLSLAIQHFQPQPISPNLCFSTDWDKLHDLRQTTLRLRKTTMSDKFSQLTGAHHQILQTVSQLIQSNEPNQYNKDVLTQPQLLVDNTVVSNQHMKMIRTHSKEHEAIHYLCTKNNWPLDVFNSIEYLQIHLILSNYVIMQDSVFHVLNKKRLYNIFYPVNKQKFKIMEGLYQSSYTKDY
jgi:hypothetical protein